MRDYAYARMFGQLTYVMYVIRFGWPRWSDQARLRWAEKYHEACLESASLAAAEISRLRTRLE